MRIDDKFDDYLESITPGKLLVLARRFLEESADNVEVLAETRQFQNWLRADFEGYIESRRIES